MPTTRKNSSLDNEKPEISVASEKTEDKRPYQVVAHIEADPKEAYLDWCVDQLELCGGDLDVFCELFKAPGTFVVFQIERRLQEGKDIALRERWDSAIALFQTTRMKLLQREAIKKLEEIDPGDDKAARIELAFAKLVLGDLLAASATASRQKVLNFKPPSSKVESIIEELSGDPLEG